ncbi:MAG: hypothetical protein WA947_22970 [Phormidesmis sp.]
MNHWLQRAIALFDILNRWFVGAIASKHRAIASNTHQNLCNHQQNGLNAIAIASTTNPYDSKQLSKALKQPSLQSNNLAVLSTGTTE